MASRRPGNCRASAIYKEGAELVVDARGRRRSSAASSVDDLSETPDCPFAASRLREDAGVVGRWPAVARSKSGLAADAAVRWRFDTFAEVWQLASVQETSKQTRERTRSSDRQR